MTDRRRLRRASGYLPGSLILTIMDSETGKIASTEGTHFDELDAHWWVDGNGSCDCNRAFLFSPGLFGSDCLGCKRYLIVAAEGATCGYTVKDFNREYSPELLAECLAMAEVLTSTQ